jgi:hypothetical protein
VRVLVVGMMGAALGFGAGWAVFERPWEAEPATFTPESVERASAAALGSRVRYVNCGSPTGPFYECRAYTSADTGADYRITVTNNGRCMSGTRDDPSRREELLSRLDEDSDAFEHESTMPAGFPAWLSDRSDC